MNSINKQTSTFELSRFNKSGNALSPITNSASSNTTLSSRRLVQARQTSTPLTKTPPWQQTATNSIRSPHINSSLLNRSPRYSLSSVNASPKLDVSGSPKPTIQTVTGPLLASTRFNVNLGTYMDTKSPGLANRIVQYNNELAGEQSSTHQIKYGSPGQFPIVQLYKKDLPILTRTSRRCTVRIAPPDPVSYSSEHASTILRDSFMQKNIDSTSKQDQCDTEINTKSVLEALKEISRKRIHTNDDLEDISKRQRKNSIHSPNNIDHLNKDGKRMREDTPPKPKDTTNTTPVNNSAPKRICVVNEIESSLSSSRLMRLQQQGQKRKSTLNISENNKQRKISNGELISRETQTMITNGLKLNTLSTSSNTSKISTAAQTETEKPEQPVNNVQSILESARRKKNSDRRTIDDIDEENSTLQFSEVNKKPTKPFFSEAPLEILKQNKLAVMLSALSGQKPELIPLPIMTLSALKKRAEEDKTDSGGVETKEVVSILSPKNKVKHDKHVTFSIPNSESDSKSDEPISVVASSPSLTIDANKISFNPLIPIQFSSPSATSSNSISVPKSNFNFSSAITATSMASPSNNNISFGPITTTTVSTNIITSSIENKGNISLESQNKSSPPVPNFNTSFEPLSTHFGGLVPSSTNIEKIEPAKTITTSFPISTASSLPKLATTSTNSSNMFGIGTANPLTFSTSAVKSVAQPNVAFSSMNPPAFSIPVTSAISVANTTLNQQPTILSTSNATSPPNFFNFGAKTDGKTTISSAPNAQPPKTGGFKFDLGKSPTAISINSTTTSGEAPKPPPAFNAGNTQFTFGATPTTSIANPVASPATSGISFGTPITTTSSSLIFGASSNSAFGIPSTLSTNTPGFPTPSSASKNLFGISATTKTNAFNTNTTTATAASGMFGSTGVFGNANTSTNSTPVTTTTSSNVFGAPTTNTTTGIFGSSTTTPNFGASKADNPPPPFGSFGTANTAQTTPGFRAFNAPTTTQNTNSFNAFGSTATTQATNAFGNAQTTTQNTTFGNISTTTLNNTFGSIATTTQQSTTFGSAPATTNKAFTFGPSTTPKEFSFGSSTAATTTASNVFGTTAPSAPSNLFGGNANSAFRNPATTPPNAFGTTTTTTASTTFGPSSSGVFGTPNNSNFNNNGGASAVFGGNGTNANNNNAFGSSAPSSVFGSTNQQPANSFAPGTSNVFGATNNTNQTGNTLFGTTTNNTTFGSNTNAFGTSGFNNNNNNSNNNNNNTAQAPSFGNFGSPAPQPSAPQSSGVFAFGSSAPPAAAPPPGSNAFQFGAAATQVPKPAGFNFSGSSAPNINFGSGATQSFNATPSPAFGSPAPSGFNANAPATGMFNIGSGSTAPKQRPMIKARRRN